MTWEEAKDQIAKKYGYKTWQSINFYELDENLSILEAGFDSSTLIDEAAELYARSKWDEACDASRVFIWGYLRDKTHTNDVHGDSVQMQYVARATNTNARKPEFKP